MTPEERQTREDRARLDAEIAAHLRNPDLVRELVEDHILGLTFECRGVDRHGQVHCHEALATEEAPPA